MSVTVGNQLTAPEAGWKRYDDTHYAIKYEGNWGIGSNTSFYNGSHRTSNIQGSKVSFSFNGSSIRIISIRHSSYENNIPIKIDGIIEYFSLYSSSGAQYQILSYEKLNLDNKVHTVEIENPSSNYISIDAIDIDETGRLLHPDEVTDPSQLDIGKRIRCHYSATSDTVGTFSNLGEEAYIDGINDFIPPESSATPDGDFYFICVDKDHLGRWKLIADRNIQHSISWDTLNSEGIASGSGVEIKSIIHPESIVPNMTDYTSPEGTVTFSSEFSGNYPAWKAFDGNYEKADSIWVANGKSGWLAYEFTNNKVVKQYAIYTRNSETGNAPKDWTFEGWDGTNWVVLDTQVGVIDWKVLTPKIFNIENTTGYKKYRINVTDNNGLSNMGFSELLLMDESSKVVDSYENYTLITRLLTGGISSTDTDNEWDKYIVNSTLNGTITAGDNNVWNWSGTINTITSTTGQYDSQTRVVRGGDMDDNLAYLANDNTVKSYANRWSYLISTYIGFRPVLTVESLYTPTIKYLFEDNGEYKSFDGSTWTSHGTTIDESVFLNSGMSDLSSIDSAALDLLTSDTPKLLMYHDDSNKTSATANVEVTPNGQLVFPTGDIDVSYGVQSFSINAVAENNSILKIIVSVDQGTSWFTFDGASWVSIQADEVSVKNNGMTPTMLSNLTESQIDDLIGESNTLRFAYYLEQDQVTDALYVDDLTIEAKPITTETPTLNSMKVTFDELTVEGRMQDLEKINAVNIAKLNFKTNALVGSSKYNMEDMIVDTFEDQDTNPTVDTENTTAEYDTTTGEYKGTNGGEEVVLPDEVFEKGRKHFMFNAEGEDVTYQYSLNGGSWMTITPGDIINLPQDQQNIVKFKAIMNSSASRLRGVATSWV